MAEEIDLEMCNFRNFGSSVTFTLTLDRVEVIPVRIPDWGLPTHQIRSKSEKLFCGRTDGRTDGWTDGRTHLSSNLLGDDEGDDLKMETKDCIEGSFGNEFSWIYNQCGVMAARSRKMLEIFLGNFCIKKTTPCGKIFKILFQQNSPPHRSTCCV